MTAIDTDGNDTRETLFVSFLEPGFMFTALFKDAFETMTDAEMAAYQALPPAVLGDLKNIVSYALQSDLTGMTLVEQGQQIYPMLPN